jgi:hypothetical protein
MEIAVIPMTQESSHVEITNFLGIVHFEFIPQGHTVNQTYYVKILKQLCELCVEKGLNFGPMILFSTMTVHKLLTVKQFLAHKLITEMEHPPSPPDLAPNGVWLFTKIKSA